MSDQNQNPKKLENLSEARALKELSGDGPWNLIQEIVQEIQASYLVKDPSITPASTLLREKLLEEIKTRYSDDENLQFFLDSVPSSRTIRNWVKKDNWEEAVWAKLRAEGLFSQANRTAVIEALRLRAIDKSDTAAKLWLTMSGDYQEKMDINSDKTIEAYREINAILHKKSKE